MRVTHAALLVTLASCRAAHPAPQPRTPSSTARSSVPPEPEASPGASKEGGPAPAARARFYHLAEGSELFPLTFLRALEAEDESGSTIAFMSERNLTRYGLLPDPPSTENPGGLPVGMTLDASSNPELAGFQVVGFNCAACHVAQVEAEGRVVRIDGAPNLFDIKRFNSAVASRTNALKRPSEALAFFLRLHRDQPAIPHGAKGMAISGPHGVRIEGPDAPRPQGGATARRSMLDGFGDLERAVYQQVPSWQALRRGGPVSRALARELELAVAEEFKLADRLSLAQLARSHLGRPDPAAQGLAEARLASRERGARPARIDVTAGEGPSATSALHTIPADITEEHLTTYVSPQLRKALRESAIVDFMHDTPRGPDLKRGVLAFAADFRLTLRWIAQRLVFLWRVDDVSDYNETTRAGPGRADAFVTARNLLFGSEYAAPTDSPICFPHLWGFAHNRWLHWDANTTSVLERNIGQAIGLGAVVDPESFDSSLKVRALRDLEAYARRIPSPVWPFETPPASEVAAGRGVFAEHCGRCHAPGVGALDQAGQDVGTDPSRLVSFNLPVAGRPFSLALGELLGHVKQRSLERSQVSAQEQQVWEPQGSLWRSTSAYANRSLEGIWASPPYLHNGSVPSLEQLLLPPEQRVRSFQLGTRAYDVKHAGYVDGGTFTFDTSRPGNSNAGHAYGTQLVESQRAQLLAYLKTL